MITTYVGIGSNLQRHQHIEAAVGELRRIGHDLRLSTIYECESVGFDSHAFYNLVVEMKTELSLAEFALTLRDIELRWGRESQAKKFQDRTLDLDIILFGDTISATAPVLPRPDIYHYPFVIQPLYELCPERCIPGTQDTIQHVWQQAQGLEALKPVELWFALN
ncbi:2-amino-4-hydroxy-6-hydroxymethyldihydropteridine diphosphokinase [Vibrio furnissii]|uniref:2-amino-4-hydroxy-6- hydroxymethyldihydropteridine diphosphokinase n=1 Tax=Vibrio furnissii TaxID=29494 RepID=UPI0024BBDCE4|nr:2-amino-4-hydroxy-6-hydroxymethyldihydropteridine diphosphokinase [Vibrio furnissii]WHR51027.1 2-amino-4-hydroxy-6-hydroxymethyldihydropteridine diphosphokinase [Vibrio furnissii]